MTASAKGPRPWFKFQFAQWMGKAEIRQLPPAARGILVDLMCLAHQSPTYGVLLGASGLPLTEAQIRGLIPGLDRRTFTAAMRDLISMNVLTRVTNGGYAIPDMVSAWEKEEKARVDGAKAGRAPPRTPSQTLEGTPQGTLEGSPQGTLPPKSLEVRGRGNPQPSILLPLPARKAAPAPAVAVETPRGPQRAWWSGVPHKPSTGGGIAIGPYTRRDGTKGVGAWKLEGIEADTREAVGWAEGFGDWSAMAEWLCEEIEWPVIIDAIRERTKQKTYRGCTSLRFFDKMVRAAWQAHETRQQREAM